MPQPVLIAGAGPVGLIARMDFSPGIHARAWRFAEHAMRYIKGRGKSRGIKFAPANEYRTINALKKAFESQSRMAAKLTAMNGSALTAAGRGLPR